MCELRGANSGLWIAAFRRSMSLLHFILVTSSSLRLVNLQLLHALTPPPSPLRPLSLSHAHTTLPHTHVLHTLGVESYQWLRIGIPVATLPGAWRYRVSTGTGRPSVSILWLGEVERLICNFYLSVAARKIVCADPSQRYTSLLLGRRATSKQTIAQSQSLSGYAAFSSTVSSALSYRWPASVCNPLSYKGMPVGRAYRAYNTVYDPAALPFSFLVNHATKDEIYDPLAGSR